MSLVAVHRLREVACLYGFTRFEPAPLATDELEDVGLAVSGAPLAQTPEWLPAVEQFGEGFFLQFAPEALAHWLSQPAVLTRARQLQAGSTCGIRGNAATDSDGKRPPNPIESGHRFRSKAATAC
jgi:hypothetical protein